MQAIILAAGMGKRLGEYTKDNTKCMLPINGERLIDRTLSILSNLQIKNVTIVIGYKGEKLKKHIGSRYKKTLNIEYIENPIYDKTNNIYSLSLAQDKMMKDDTLLFESDLIYEEGIVKNLLDNPWPNLALVAKWEYWMDGTVVKIDKDKNILSFVSKELFDFHNTNEYYKTINIYKFSKEFAKNKYIPFLQAYCKAWGNNEYYEEVLKVLTFLNRTDLKALPIGNEKWYEIDDVQDLDIAETLFANERDILKKYHKRYGGFWRFPKILDFCYLVNPYFPTQHMKEEMKACFDTLLTEYPSGMFVNSLLAGKYFNIKQDYVVVGNGAAELIKSIMKEMKGKIGIVYPTFEEYPNRLNKDAIVPFNATRKDYNYTAEDLKTYFGDKKIEYLLVINPDNPSGNFITTKEIIKLVQWCKDKDIHIIIDESFVDFSEDFENNSLLHNEILEAYPNLKVIKSISKSYGVPGLRLGILASCDTELISHIKKDVSIWNINSFGEYYMQIFGKYSKDYVSACHEFIQERKRFQIEMSKISFIRVVPSQANFFMIEISGRFTSETLSETLLKKYNILIKSCNTKKGLENKNYVRIAVRSKHDNDLLIEALKELDNNKVS